MIGENEQMTGSLASDWSGGGQAESSAAIKQCFEHSVYLDLCHSIHSDLTC